MIKGVNKKIIEINDTNNIYFEKAVLYVRPQMNSAPQRHLMNEARNYLDQMYPEKHVKKFPGTLFFLICSAVFAAAVLVAVLFG